MSYNNLYRLSPVWLQNALVSVYGYRWKQRRFGGVFKREYLLGKERENFTVAQWQNYQQQQLQKIVQHAFETVPYYKTSFTEKGLTAAGIKNISAENMWQLPVLSKQQLRQYGTGLLLSSTREKGGTFLASSGTTGTPTQILYSPAMHQRWFGLYEARVRNWAGVGSDIPRGMIGGRRVVADAHAHPPFYRYNYFEKQVYFSAYHINKANAADYLKGIQQYNVEYMTGYAMSNFFLARFFKEANLQAPALKAVITSSEILTPEMRTVFKEVYDCKTFDGWGSVEACGLITECEQGSLHISLDAGLIEVLDDNMQPVAASVPGTVYCTGFLNYDQPLIRYNIGDTITLSDKTCSCGRNMPVVKEIGGRTEDIVIGKDGREMVRFHSIFNNLQSVKQAQVIQESLENISVKIVSTGKLDPQEDKMIRQRIESQLGNVHIAIEEVESIALNNNGKFRAVISKVKRPVA